MSRVQICNIPAGNTFISSNLLLKKKEKNSGKRFCTSGPLHFVLFLMHCYYRNTARDSLLSQSSLLWAYSISAPESSAAFLITVRIRCLHDTRNLVKQLPCARILLSIRGNEFCAYTAVCNFLISSVPGKLGLSRSAHLGIARFESGFKNEKVQRWDV